MVLMGCRDSRVVTWLTPTGGWSERLGDAVRMTEPQARRFVKEYRGKLKVEMWPSHMATQSADSVVYVDRISEGTKQALIEYGGNRHAGRNLLQEPPEAEQ